jgi:hypothetical protein
MKQLFIIAITALGLTAQAQVKETRNTGSFKNIEVINGVTLVYTQGEVSAVTAETETKDMMNSLVTRVVGNTLRIFMKESQGKKAQPHGAVKVYITQSSISRLKAASGASIKIEGSAYLDDLDVNLSSGASFTGKVTSNEFVLNARSGSSFKGVVFTDAFTGNLRAGAGAKLTGTAKKATISTDSASTCIASTFVTDKAYVNAKGTSSVFIKVKDSIKATTDNSASITYYGEPNVNLGEGSYAIKRFQDKL